MYKARMMFDGNRTDLENALSCINDEGGIIISTTACLNYAYVFYEVPNVK